MPKTPNDYPNPVASTAESKPPSSTQSPGGSVSRSTLYLAVCAACILGFVGGVGYSAFKAAPASAPVQQTPDKPRQPGAITPEMLVALEQRAEQDPDNVKVWEELGNAFSDHGQAEDAIAAYTRALAVDPDNHDVRTDLGSAFFQAGKPELALLEFDKVLSIDPNHPQARFNRGVVLYNGLGAKQGALAEWKQLLTSHPNLITPGGMPLKDFIQAAEANEAESAPRRQGGELGSEAAPARSPETKKP